MENPSFHVVVTVNGSKRTLHYCNEDTRKWQDVFQWNFGFWPEDWRFVKKIEIV